MRARQWQVLPRGELKPVELCLPKGLEQQFHGQAVPVFQIDLGEVHLVIELHIRMMEGIYADIQRFVDFLEGGRAGGASACARA